MSECSFFIYRSQKSIHYQRCESRMPITESISRGRGLTAPRQMVRVQDLGRLPTS